MLISLGLPLLHLRGLVATVIAITRAYFLWILYLSTLKARILHILLRTLPEPIVNMIQLPQPASALVPPLQKQPLLEPIR